MDPLIFRTEQCIVREDDDVPGVMTQRQGRTERVDSVLTYLTEGIIAHPKSRVVVL